MPAGTWWLLGTSAPVISSVFAHRPRVLRLPLCTQVDGATDSPDGSASTSFCTGQEPAPQQQQQQQQRQSQHPEHQQSHCGVPAAAAAAQQQENTSATMQSAPRLPRCGSAFVDAVFGAAQLPDEQRTMLKDLLNEGISSNSYRTIISQQMRKLPPERVRSNVPSYHLIMCWHVCWWSGY